MVVICKAAALSILLPAAVLARPNAHEKFHNRRHFTDIEPSGIHGGPPTGLNPTAPYPAGNGTRGAATGTATGGAGGNSLPPVTIQSVITVVPVPVASMTGQGPAGAQSGAPGGSPGAAGNSGTCGPATVTVTQANTVTVTVQPGGAQTQSTPPTVSHPPVQEKAAGPPPVAATSTPAPAPAPAPPVQQKYKAPAPPPAIAPAKSKPQPQPQQQHSAAAASQSQPPKKASDNVGPRGIAYTDLSQANAMGGLGWGCDWDSSPMPAVGNAQGKLSAGQFVPTLLGPASVHTSIWNGNSQGYPWVMGFNEPNKDISEGGCGPMAPGDAASQMGSLMSGNQEAGQKITTACVSNDAPDWLDQFISSSSVKYDAVCFHWYGNTLQELQGIVSTFQNLQKKYNIPELWMSEWAFNSEPSSSDLQEVLSYLDGSGVNRYAYNAQKMTPSVQAAYAS